MTGEMTGDTRGESAGSPTINKVTGIVIGIFGVLMMVGLVVQSMVSDEDILEAVAVHARKVAPQLDDEDIRERVEQNRAEILRKVRGELRNQILAGILMVLVSGALAFGVIARHKSARGLAVIFGILMGLGLIAGLRKLAESADVTNVIGLLMVVTLLVLSVVAFRISKPAT